MLAKKLSVDNSIILKMASAKDLPAIFQLVDSYSDDIKIDTFITKRSIREMVYANGALLVEYDGELIGGIGGYIMPSMYNEDMIFSVMFFYVRKEFRFLTRRIIKELELASLPTKATKLIFGVPINDSYDKLVRFYRMMGYSRLETHMCKNIHYA